MTLTLVNNGAATQFDWTVEQGELVQLRIPVLDAGGAPFAVDGWTVDAKVKHRFGGETLHTWLSGDITVSGANVTLTILPATSMTWTFTRAVYRVKIIHPTDLTQVYRIVQGPFHVRPD